VVFPSSIRVLRPPVQPLFVHASTLVSALGAGGDATRLALVNDRTGLATNDFEPAPVECFVGRVADVEAVALPPALREFDCRNHQLALLALEQDGFSHAVARARQRY